MKTLLVSIVVAASSVGMLAQQNVGFKSSSVVSPIVNSDNSITFQVEAPKAKSVIVKGDWEAEEGIGTLKKGKDGIWSYTTPALPSEMYTYRVNVDGVIGIDPTNPFSCRDVGSIFSLIYVNNGCADYYQVKDVPHGTMSTTWYHSNEVNLDRRLTIYTPPCYEKSDRSYPVLYLLHGSGGDETAWAELGRVARIMDNLIAEGKAEPMIVVMPNGNSSKQASPGETSENLSYKPLMTNMIPDSYKNGKYEKAFPEIVNFVDSRYKTIPAKDKRALAGLSMGGMHTLFISATYPDMFGYIGLFSAGVNFSTVDMTLPIYSDLDGKLANQSKAGYQLYWIACGNTDFLYQNNKDLMSRMDKVGLKYTYHESTRGHLWVNWRQYLLEFSQKLFK
ncbi:MAG: alpha/beta hydrolase-fold protein [Muribaculaceae bacterium]|nr:alpha/beta hydrolase-fold protein [Muribaculaceae bacterium]